MMSIHVQTGLVFYDLEWTGSELLQIGAVADDSMFERTILTQADIHYKVSQSILLETRVDDQGKRQVFDISSGSFIPSCSLSGALSDFLDWLQYLYFKHGQVILISHGSVDIPVLLQSLALVDLDELFLERVTSFVNFQDYLKKYFGELPRSLAELVNICGLKNNYRLHSAVEDARALCDIFQKLHGDFSSRSMLWKSNTSLVLTNTCKFGFEYEPFPRISLTFIVIDRESKYMRQLSAMINKDAPDPDTPRVVKSIQIQAWLGHVRKLNLFAKVDPPSCVMLSVSGWVTRHSLVGEYGDKVTEIDLLCFVGATHFCLTFRPNLQSTFMKKKVLLTAARCSVLARGTRVEARLQLKSRRDPRVMYILPDTRDIGDLDTVLGNLGTGSIKLPM